jgi:hypothetical protein
MGLFAQGKFLSLEPLIPSPLIRFHPAPLYPVINNLTIVTTSFHKIPPYLPFPKGGKVPLFGKEGGRGDFVKGVYSIAFLLISIGESGLWLCKII